MIEFKNMTSLMNYKTYNNINRIWCCLLYADQILSPFLIKSEIFRNLAIFEACGFAIFNLITDECYTKDVLPIKKLYYEFIKNYSKLNKVFHLTNPVQISTMFEYLLKKGYLSSGKSYTFSNLNDKNISSIKGVIVVTGRAVCRHIASMLRDILNEEGISSSRLGVYDEPVKINVSRLEKPKYTEEELLHIINKIENWEDFDGAIKLFKSNPNIEIVEYQKCLLDIVEKLFGNHAITFAHQNERNYFLDPTQGNIYRMRENKLYKEKYNKELPIKLMLSYLNNSKENYFNMVKNIKKYPQISLEEEAGFVNETLDICKNNMDIFERFYSRHLAKLN